MTWPIGRAADFAGTYDLRKREMHLTKDLGNPIRCCRTVADEVDLIRSALPEFDLDELQRRAPDAGVFRQCDQGYRRRDLLDGLAEYGPRPRAQPADKRTIQANEAGLTALVFKIQANMDPNHRDRIAFARVCSGGWCAACG